MSESAQVLVVCTGNVCRSPFLERLLQARVEQRWGDALRVRSAGTGALVGHPMDERSAQQLRVAGGDATGFVARALEAEMIAAADLVLTATREHRGLVARLHPRSVRYCFAVADFADLAEGMPAADLPRSDLAGPFVRAAVEAVAARRGLRAPLAPSEADIIDPYQRKDRVMAQMARQVTAALPPMVRVLGGAAPPA